ncbi:unnamed protein product [Timema podura]|uniref:Peptidase S1 domain-containing protein n=1 Tax=Timema podura TaxID=61482 RepID=A0ABN7NMD8_TIMPD|nr:unnamed protein product [Timema podura]
MKKILEYLANLKMGWWSDDLTRRRERENIGARKLKRAQHFKTWCQEISGWILLESIVEKTFQFNSKLQPIEIYPDVDIPDGSKVTVMGWGYTDPEIYIESSVLMKVELEVWPVEECEKVYGKVNGSIICAGLDKKGGSCMGDSGGPMIFKGKLVGIVSAGSGECGAGLQPEGFYTKVPAYKDWIDSHTVRRRRRKGSRCMARFSYSRRSPKY